MSWLSRQWNGIADALTEFGTRECEENGTLNTAQAVNQRVIYWLNRAEKEQIKSQAKAYHKKAWDEVEACFNNTQTIMLGLCLIEEYGKKLDIPWKKLVHGCITTGYIPLRNMPYLNCCGEVELMKVIQICYQGWTVDARVKSMLNKLAMYHECGEVALAAAQCLDDVYQVDLDSTMDKRIAKSDLEYRVKQKDLNECKRSA